MKKRILSLLLGGAIAVGGTIGLAACSSNSKNGITIWASQDDQTVLQEMIALFKEENPDFNIPITTGVVGASDALTNIKTDVKASADIYCYANDQIVDLNVAGGLSALSPAMVDKIKAENDPQSVESAHFGDKYLGYPYAADNGYFLYYNKNVISEEQAKTLEGILDACEASMTYFIYNMTEAWYVGTFFLGENEKCVGGTYTYEYEGSAISEAYTNFDKNANGSTEYSIGQIGGQAMIDLNKRSGFVSGGDDEISKYLKGNGKRTNFGACISGTWNAEAIQKTLGDNYAATKLPTFHSSLNDKDYQMGSLTGYKLFGVNPNSKHLDEAHQIAAFLSSEKMQDLRFDRSQTGPSNVNVAKQDKIKENVALNALIEQSPYATAQGAFSQKYWNAMKAFGGNVYGKKPTITSDNLTSQLEDFYKAFKE